MPPLSPSSDVFSVNTLTGKLLRLWLWAFAASVATVFLMGFVHSAYHGGAGFLLISSGSAWAHTDLPWYDTVMVRAADLTEKLIFYPVGYALLCAGAILLFAKFGPDDPQDGEVLPLGRRILTFSFIFGAPLLLLSVLSLKYHHVL